MNRRHSDNADPKRRSTISSGLFWAIAIIVLSTGIFNEFHAGHDGWCAARRAVAARNAIDEGFLETRAGMILNIGAFDKEEYKAYWHHPQGIHWLTTGAFVLLGEGPIQARIAPTLLTLLNLFLLLQLAVRWFPTAPHILTGLLFLSVPMLTFYGPFVAHQPLMLTASLCVLLLWEQTRSNSVPPPIWLTGITAAWGGFTAWPWFIFAFFLGLPILLQYRSMRPKERRWLVVFSAGTVAGAILVLTHGWWQSGADLQEITTLFSGRSSGKGISTSSLLTKMSGPWAELFNPYLCVLGLLYLIRLPTRLRRKKPVPEAHAAISFLLTGVVWTLLFKQGASVHEYWPWYTAPFFVISGASVCFDVHGWLQTRKGPLKYAMGIPLALIILTGAGISYGRHTHPSQSHPEWSDGYFRDKIEAWKWIRQHTDRADKIVLSSTMIPGAGRAQYRFYGNREYRKISEKDLLKSPVLKKHEKIVATDLEELSGVGAHKVLSHWREEMDIVMLDSVLIGLKRGMGESPFIVYKSVQHARPWLAPTSGIFEWVQSDLLRKGYLLGLGETELALTDLNSLPVLSENTAFATQERIALYNLKNSAGLPLPPIETLLTGKDIVVSSEPMLFGDEVKLLHTSARYQWEFGVKLTFLLRVEKPLTKRWKPTLKSLRTYEGKQKKEKRNRPFTLLGSSDHWKPGHLILLERYAPLPNRDSLTGVEYQFALWSEGNRKLKQRSSFLRPAGENHFITVHPEPERHSSVLSFLGMRWIRNSDGK